MTSVQHIIEPGLTAFSAAEIHVVLFRTNWPYSVRHLSSPEVHISTDKFWYRPLYQLVWFLKNICTNIWASSPSIDRCSRFSKALMMRMSKHSMHSVLMTHASWTQVDLGNVRSFYKESQKSPFKFFPWKTGSMHFKFLSVSQFLACKANVQPMHMHMASRNFPASDLIVMVFKCSGSVHFGKRSVGIKACCDSMSIAKHSWPSPCT